MDEGTEPGVGTQTQLLNPVALTPALGSDLTSAFAVTPAGCLASISSQTRWADVQEHRAGQFLPSAAGPLSRGSRPSG